MIPVNEPLLGGKELEYVTEAIQTNWISSEGRFIGQFEESFARYCGRKYAVAVNNGTSALILAVRALDLPVGSEVIMPSFTIVSCALACIYNGLVPVFVDSEPDSWNMDCALVEKVLTPRTSAIMAVHIYGHPVDMTELERIAASRSIPIIEDFAEAIGSEYFKKRCGGFGKVSCASFYANKVITTGEGGMCLTDDEALAAQLRALRNLAFVPQERFRHEELGFNFRLTNLQAAIGLAQVERVADHVDRKLRMGAFYRARLQALEDQGLLRLPIERAGMRNTFWMFGFVLAESAGLSASEMAVRLAKLGVQTRPFFFPLHRQPAFQAYEWFLEQELPVADELYRRGLYLPSGLTLTEEQQARVVKAVAEVLQA